MGREGFFFFFYIFEEGRRGIFEKKGERGADRNKKRQSLKNCEMERERYREEEMRILFPPLPFLLLFLFLFFNSKYGIFH
jgi:hypothetical protein